MKKRLPFLLITLSIIIFCNDLYANEKWKLVNNKNGIKSYSRKVKGSDILEIKAITVINAKMEVVGAVMRDISAYPKWQSDCKAARVIKKFDENNMIIYNLLDFPAPVSDRDVIVSGKTDYNIGLARGIIKLRTRVMPSAPEKKGIIRMKNFSGTYIMEYLSRNRTGIIYSYKADPGGSIPAFIINIFSKKSLNKTLTGLKRMVKLKKYIKIGANSKDKKLFENILKNKKQVRKILQRRLLEQIKDKEIVELVINDKDIFNLFVYGEGIIAKKIFYAWGSKSAVKKTVKMMLKIHLKKHTSDNKKIDLVLNNKNLINSIVYGTKKGEASVKKRIFKIIE